MTIFHTNEEMYVKLKSGGTSYDVLFPSDYMIARLIKEDMLHKIDMNNITNLEHIGEEFKGLGYDPNNEYSVPYMWGTVGYCTIPPWWMTLWTAGIFSGIQSMRRIFSCWTARGIPLPLL
jgi:hypothetical protein